MSGGQAADLLAPAGRALLRRAVAERWLLGFDFDGTLAPLVQDAAAAAMTPAVEAALAALAARRPVAVITGRSLADVRLRLPPIISLVVGNHGGEGPGGDPGRLAAARTTAAVWRASLAAALAGEPLRIEDKGVSLALHWRGAADPPRQERLAGLAAAALEPRPELIPGDHVLNLLPAGLPDKGAALLRLLGDGGWAGALFAGDDITDQAVFRLRDPRIAGIEVGRRLGAPWRLPDQAAVGVLVQALLDLATEG